MYDVATINFNVWKDKHRFMGIASVKLPDIVSKIVSLSGAGIAGDIEVPLSGQLEAMEATFNFNASSADVALLRAPVRHNIELRPAVQQEDPVKGELIVVPEKHVLVIVPKSSTGVTLAPAGNLESTLVTSVRYWKKEIDGVVVQEIDPMNHIFIIGGVDYGEPVRKALGY